MYLVIFDSVVMQASNERGFILQTRTRLPRGHKKLKPATTYSSHHLKWFMNPGPGRWPRKSHLDEAYLFYNLTTTNIFYCVICMSVPLYISFQTRLPSEQQQTKMLLNSVP